MRYRSYWRLRCQPNTPVRGDPCDAALPLPSCSTYNRMLRMSSNILLPVETPRRRFRLWALARRRLDRLLLIAAAVIALALCHSPLSPSRSRRPSPGRRNFRSCQRGPRQSRRSCHRSRHARRSLLRPGIHHRARPPVSNGPASALRGGELSEIVGDIALKHDRQQRILGIRATAEKGLLAAPPEDREQFAAYARGVNAYIRTHRDRLPLEFRALRYSPRPWTEQDSLMIAYQMVQTLSTNPLFALTRERVLAKLGPETDRRSLRQHFLARPSADRSDASARRSPVG